MGKPTFSLSLVGISASNKFESPLLNELMEVGFTDIWTTNFDNTIELNYQKKNITCSMNFY